MQCCHADALPWCGDRVGCLASDMIGLVWLAAVAEACADASGERT